MSIPSREIVCVIAPSPMSMEARASLQRYLDQCVAQERPILLEDGYRVEVIRAEPVVTLADHQARVNALLEANNGYQDRYRKAESQLKDALSRVSARTGDHVLHRPSGETWVLAYADHEAGFLCACGWPESEANMDDCELVYVAQKADYEDLLVRLEDRRGDRARQIAERESRP
jgi:hypothetical protein